MRSGIVIRFVMPSALRYTAACVALPLLLCCTVGDENVAMPNVVIILADDLGYGDLSVYGGSLPTPNIDRLAEQGVLFTDGYASASVCRPSRVTLLTGRYPQRGGYDFNQSVMTGLLPKETTLGELLRDTGYATAFIGKWHLGTAPRSRPMMEGFDTFFGFLDMSMYVDPRDPGVKSWVPGRRGIPRWGVQLLRGNEPVKEKEYLTDALTREALSFIDAHRDTPFLLMVSHLAPHIPLQATKSMLDDHRDIASGPRQIYAAMLSSLDDGVGAIVDRLDDLGLTKRTLLIFTSDHGCLFYKDRICSNGPFAGGKRDQREGGLRVPMLARWPGQLPAGRIYQHPVFMADVFATAAAAAGADTSGLEIDGVDLLPYLTGSSEEAPHARLHWRTGPNWAIREGRWKMWRVNLTSRALRPGARTGAVYQNYESPSGSPAGQLTVLYDLSEDPGEKHNLAASHPEIVKRLEQAHASWAADLPPPQSNSNLGVSTRIHGELVELIF